MIAKRWFTNFAALAITLGVCRVAHANSLSAYAYFWPGVVSITVVFAFPTSLLAAFIERPFLTAAGITRRPLVLSLRANFLSTIVGILLIPIGYPALYTIGPLWSMIAIWISCVVEISYLRRFSHQSFSLDWAVLGNLASSAVLMILPPIVMAIEEHNHRLAWIVEPHREWLTMSLLAVSVAVFLASFVWPGLSKADGRSSDSDTPASTPAEVGAGSEPTDTDPETAV